jgi:hypothetical protein
MPTMVKLICQCCQKEFERLLGEVNRNKKKNREIYCSLACNAKNTINKKIPPEKHGSLFSDISKYSSNHLDEFSPFRYHLKNVRSHTKKNGKEFDITLQDLKEQWEKQQGVCPHTGWKLKNAENTNVILPLTPDRASLDRIDSSKGYIKGNIQFVAYMYNICKNNFQHEDVVNFSVAVVGSNLSSNIILPNK